MNFWWPFGIDAKTKQRAGEMVAQAFEHARDPALYTQAGVSDTLDGRFQLAGLFVTRAILDSGDKKLRQAIFDRFFQTCEMSLREMGIGDLSVPKKLKDMMIALHGHAAQYELCFAGKAPWDEALRRNVYGAAAAVPSSQQIEFLINYIEKNSADQYAA